MEEIKGLLNGMMDEIKEIRKDNGEYKEEIRLIKSENKEIKDKMESMKQRIEQLELIEQNVERIEKEKIKNNLIISGLKLSEQNHSKIIQQEFFKVNLKVDVKINEIIKIKEALHIFELDSFEKKLEILKLKGKTEALKEARIYINSDLTKEEQKIQKQIREIEKTEKDKGSDVKVGIQYLIVNGVRCRWNKITRKLEDGNMECEKYKRKRA